MKKLTSLSLSVLLMGSAIACSKAPESNNNALVPNSIPVGTVFEVDVPTEISTGKNVAQDRLTFPVHSSLMGGNADLKGAKVEGHLENVVKAARGRKASLNLVFDEIKFKDGSVQPLNVQLLNTKVETKTKGQFLKNAGIILGGAVAGKFVGDKVGQKHGGLAGAAAATAFVLSSPGGDVVLKKGTDLELKLKSPLTLAKAGT